MSLPSLSRSLSAPLAHLLRRILDAISSLGISTAILHAAHPLPLPSSSASDPPSTWTWQGVLDTLHWSAILRIQLISSSSESEIVHDEPPDRLSNRSPPPEPSHTARPPSTPPPPHPDTPLYRLMFHPLLFDPIRTPRLPIVLCHGLYGFDVRGPASFPALQLHYWDNVLKILRGKVGAEVICPGVPGTGSIEQRALKMDQFLAEKVPGKEINFVAHSMGGLDCRHLISHIRPETYKPASLLTISTPHRGSAFMDWCTANIGLGTPSTPGSPLPPPPPSLPFVLKSPLLSRASHSAAQSPSPSAAHSQSQTPSSTLALALSTLPTSVTSLLLSMLDSPAYANLTTAYLTHTFNPATPDLPSVKYFSISARSGPLSILHPLWLPKLIMDAAGSSDPDGGLAGEGGNDGLVSVRSARWGEYLGEIVDCDHWEMRGAKKGLGRTLEGWVRSPPPPLPSLSTSSRDPDSPAEAHANALGQVKAAVGRMEREAREKEARREGRQRREEREERGAVDRLSAIVEWMTEYVPGTSSSSSSAGGDGRLRLEKPRGEKEKEREKDKERARFPTFDLERFYVAISRKLYDEGL